jgi:hypothetical protein
MNSDPLVYDSRPGLRKPILLLAFAGWSDAGASATTAVRYLADQLLAKISKFNDAVQAAIHRRFLASRSTRPCVTSSIKLPL